MDFSYTVYRKRDVVPSLWDGGQTFEYHIFPETAVYADRDFLFRFSSASIEKVPSRFTRFKGYNRFLVMLDNDLELVRNGIEEHYTPEDVFVFDSDDEIVSNSLGNDFNLMVSQKIKSAQVQIAKGYIHMAEPYGFFFARAKTRISCNGFSAELEAGDLLLVQNAGEVKLSFFSDEIIITGFFCCNLF